MRGWQTRPGAVTQLFPTYLLRKAGFNPETDATFVQIGGGQALESEDFTGAMGALAQLRAPVDAFFDKVTVNCDEADLRANRLRLLSEIRTTLNRVADFSQIEG